ncbi:MAG: potassium channel family protein [Acidimicrobiales bacterium]
MPEEAPARERIMAAFGPLLVIVLLASWALLQVTGFGLLWWARGGLAGANGFGDSWYYSGVVYFTVGFGEIVPGGIVPRAGALIEAFFGVITVALVVGYLPTLYSAYSDRERQLITLDAGGSDRITPTALVKAWAPDADPKKIDAQFEKWEQWAAGILETHSSVPLLVLFRSHDRRQNWVTALGLLCDAALHAQIIMGATDGNAFWFLRRAEAIFAAATQGSDLRRYEEAFGADGDPRMFIGLYEELSAHGFELRPYDDARSYTRQARAAFAPALEYLIDDLLCPRGFWSLDSTILSWSSEHEIPRYDDAADVDQGGNT